MGISNGTKTWKTSFLNGKCQEIEVKLYKKDSVMILRDIERDLTTVGSIAGERDLYRAAIMMASFLTEHAS